MPGLNEIFTEEMLWRQLNAAAVNEEWRNEYM